MRWSRAYIPTLRDDPADAGAVSHRLLVRGGFIRQLMAGSYSLLPLGKRVADKVTGIIRSEIEAIGGIEFELPVVHPGEVWKRTGRWDAVGDEMLRFKDRIAREVMVPRVDVFSLSAETPIKEAAKLIEDEGYSRVPIYRNTVDNIVGVLMYKDILSEYMKYETKDNDSAIIDAPIEKIQKNVLYTPETQKISNLLLEFRKKQVHLAIVVDEYGGTEGIVTIEDILEELSKANHNEKAVLWD